MTLAYFYMWLIEKVTHTTIHYFLDFVEVEHRCMNEVVIFQMKLVQHTKDVVQMLAVVPNALLLHPDKHILKVLARAIRGGPNSQAILRYSLHLLAVQQNNTSIDRIWNGSNLADAGIKDGSRLPNDSFASRTPCLLVNVRCGTHHKELDMHLMLLELKLRQLR